MDWTRIQLFDDVIRELESCRDLYALEQVVRRFVLTLGYHHWMFPTQIPAADGSGPQVVFLGDMPREWLLEYCAKKYIHKDPIVHQARVRSLPFCWEARRGWSHSSPAVQMLMHAFARRWSGGLCIPLHTADHLFGYFEIFFTEDIQSCHQVVELLTYTGPVFVHKLFEALRRLLLACHMPPCGLRLSALEQECLRLAAEGLPTRAVAQELGLKQRTVRHYLDTLKAKMGTRNMRETVVKATSLGLTVPRFTKEVDQAMAQWLNRSLRDASPEPAESSQPAG